MQQNTTKLIIVIGLGIVGALFYGQYYEHQRIHHINERINRFSTGPVSARCAAAPPVEVNSNESSVCRWSDLQPRVKDTVAQVFVQGVQFNWLEPYKSPEQYHGAGSGFFINDQGDLITNAHVVNQALAVSIQIPSMGKRRFEMDVVGISPERDLALLRLKPHEREAIVTVLGKIPTLSLGDSDHVRRSDEIMTLGYPLGQQSLKSTTGVVSGRENIDGHYMIQISAAINPGNSGGPALCIDGHVIGVNTAQINPAQNVNYIIPSNEVKLFLRQLEELPQATNGSVKLLRKPFLGVLFNMASEQLTSFLGNPQPGGLYVVESYKGSPLYKAGVKPGDMIYEIDGHRLDVFGELNVPWSEDKIAITDYVSRLMLGDQVRLLVYRNGKPVEVALQFTESELPPVRRMYPGYEDMDYEVFGGMVIMPLSLNLIQILIKVAPDLARYADFKNTMEPALIITHILPESVAFKSRTVGPGTVITEINGVAVNTLSELRKLMKKAAQQEFLTLKTSENMFVAFSMKQLIADEPMLSAHYRYTMTPLMQNLVEMTQNK